MTMNLILITTAIDWKLLLIVLGLMLGVSAIFGLLILLADKFFSVKQDDRVNEIVALLPHANCGGCGYPGCEGFAKALLSGKAELEDCRPAKNESRAAIASLLGLTAESSGEKIAVIACIGGNECSDKFEYQGNDTCQAQATINNGKKACAEGCMGAASCLKICNSDAIKMTNGFATIDKRHCTSCGLCLNACPKKIIKLIPKTAKVFIACSCRQKGKDVANICKKGCISCGICEKLCPSKAVTMQNNVPIIDYKKCNGCGVCAEKCPRKVILFID